MPKPSLLTATQPLFAREVSGKLAALADIVSDITDAAIEAPVMVGEAPGMVSETPDVACEALAATPAAALVA